MNYHNVSFAAAYGTSGQLPASTRPEVAFVGRSNVGKSSLLNKLFNRKKLAKVSSKPGKTSTINFFNAENSHFVDLPGYGYAQVSKSEKVRWAEMINGYFDQDRNFTLVVSLIDIRHPATSLDVQMVEFLKEAELPFHDCSHQGGQAEQIANHASEGRAAKAAFLWSRDRSRRMLFGKRAGHRRA